MPLAPTPNNVFIWEPFAACALLMILLVLKRKWLISKLGSFFGRRQATQSAQQQAIAELEANYHENDPVRYAEGLYICLRRFLKNEYALGSDSHSHTELISIIEQQLHLNSEIEQNFVQLLENCAQIKFSKFNDNTLSRENLQLKAQVLLMRLNEPSLGSEE